MVGGKVINVCALPDSVWVQCADKGDVCAIRVEYSPESSKIQWGDSLWWQSKFAYWTPLCGLQHDIKLNRIGYSHSGIPDDVMATLIPAEEANG